MRAPPRGGVMKPTHNDLLRKKLRPSLVEAVD